MCARHVAGLFFLLMSAGARPAAGATDLAWISVVVGGELWRADPIGGHGVALLAWEGGPWVGGGRPWVEYNTDTLRVGLSDVPLGERTRLGVTLTGEYAFAGLLVDHHVEGENQPERGFLASYVEGELWLKHHYPRSAWSELSVTGRRWFFARSDETDPALVLPPEAWVLSPTLRLGWWRLAPDAGWRDRHRLFPRLRGFAFGVEGGVDLRSAARPWGAIGPAFARPDPRNDPSAIIPRVRQWALLGVPLGPRARIEIEERAGIGFGEDDLSRVRLGGQNPYSVPVPGAPWAAWLSDAFVAGRLSAPVEVARGVELGPTAAAVWLRDPERDGGREAGLVWGGGATASLAWGTWQLDLRGGVSPSAAREGASWSLWLGVGWGAPAAGLAWL